MPGRAHTTFGHVHANGARVALLVLVVLAGAGVGCTTRSGGPGAGGTTPPSAPVPATQAPGAKPAGAPASRAPVPARLAAVSPAADGVSNQCLAEIETFAEQHTGNRVMLGKAAFADSDRLVLTRAPHRGSDRRPLDGRAGLPQPVVLNLLAGAEGCSVRIADGGDASPDASASGASSPAPLPGCHCVPLSR